LYGTNLRHLLTDMCPKKDGEIVVDMDDEVIRGATVVMEGKTTWPPPPPKLSAAPPAAKPAPVPAAPSAKPAPAWVGPLVALGLGAALLVTLGQFAPPEFMAHFTVFVLACFVGYMVVWNVKPALHTPLMSVTNAISSIIIIGALLQISSEESWVTWMAAITVLITGINIAGGFGVTRRMLAMFRK
jgi:NAD(P) transhydrogenase subunit alpha